MLDRLYLPFLALLSLGAIALAMVWPQGLGARSPGPFGHEPVQQAAARAAQQRQTAQTQAAAQAQADLAKAKAAIQSLQAKVEKRGK